MYHTKPARVLAAAATLALLSSCDTPADPDAFRSAKQGDCISADQAGNGTIVWRGMIPDGGDDPWWLGVESARATVAAAFARGDAEELCDAVCSEADFGWDGDGCVVDGTFELVTPTIAEKNETGWALGEVEIHAKVALGCACAG